MVMDEFQAKWELPQCVGAIDNSHISILAPELNHTDSQICKCFLSHAEVFDTVRKAKWIQHNSTPPMQSSLSLSLSLSYMQCTGLSDSEEELLHPKLAQLGITVSALFAIS